MRITDILTKSYKITIACFKPTISVGSTLAHARYYLDDPVHLLVSGTNCDKCELQFRAPPAEVVVAAETKIGIYCNCSVGSHPENYC